MKPIVPEVAPLVHKIYLRSPVGCCLHIVLDDFNTEDDHVIFCLEEAVKKGHKDCEHLAKLLLQMSETQRKKLAVMEDKRW